MNIEQVIRERVDARIREHEMIHDMREGERELRACLALKHKQDRENTIIEYPEVQRDGSVVWRVAPFETRRRASAWTIRQVVGKASRAV